MHHDEFNPCLETKAAKLTFAKVLNIHAKKSEMDFDRRFLVKAPDCKILITRNRAQDSSDRNRAKSVLNNNILPQKLYERFTNDY